MYDKDSLKNQAFLRFSDITEKNIKQKKEDHPSTNDSKAEMESKIMTAKVHANKEMETFKEATEQYMKSIEHLSLFQGVGNIVDELMIGQLLESIISPLIKGQQIPGMEEDHYRDYRMNAFKSLIEKYVDNK